MKMPRLSLALVGSMVVAASLVLSACAAPKIKTRSQTDPNVNLSSFHTYGFVAEPGTNRSGYSTPITTYFKTAITREMNARGYTYSEDSPELLINFNTNAREQVDIRSTPSMSYGYGYYGYRGGMYAAGPIRRNGCGNGALQAGHGEHRRRRCRQEATRLGRCRRRQDHRRR